MQVKITFPLSAEHFSASLLSHEGHLKDKWIRSGFNSPDLPLIWWAVGPVYIPNVISRLPTSCLILFNSNKIPRNLST